MRSPYARKEEQTMNRDRLLLDVAKNMRSLAESIEALCEFAPAEDVSAQEPEPEKKEKPAKSEKKPAVTLERVRGLLAEKSQLGFTAEVRGIIRKYGAEKLSGIDPKDYEAVLKDAEVLGNG